MCLKLTEFQPRLVNFCFLIGLEGGIGLVRILFGGDCWDKNIDKMVPFLFASRSKGGFDNWETMISNRRGRPVLKMMGGMLVLFFSEGGKGEGWRGYLNTLGGKKNRDDEEATFSKGKENPSSSVA